MIRLLFQSNEGVPNGFQLVSLIEALNGPPNAPQMTVNLQPSNARVQSSTTDLSGSTIQGGGGGGDHSVVDEVPNAVKAAQSLNGGGGVEKNSKNSPQESDKEFRLTVIPSESSDSSKTSPSLNRVSSLSRKTMNNSKSQLATGNNNNSNHSMPKSVSRDSMKVVNEKSMADQSNGHNGSSNGKAGAATTTEEDDSDDEKLSPLLMSNGNNKSLLNNESAALKMDGVDENIDDTSEGENEENHMHEVGI